MKQPQRPSVTENIRMSARLGRLQRLGLWVGLAGLLLAGVGALLDPIQFWRSYLLAYLFWLQIGLGCLGLAMLHHLAGGRWSALVRRLMESGAMTLPLLALLFVPLLFGLTTLYPWTDPGLLGQSELLQAKALYLNLPFFLVRSGLYLGTWLVLAILLQRWSLAQDQSGAPQWARRMRRLSGVGMPLYVLTATFAAYDWMMSLEPEWFSSIYGLLFIAGQGVAALALAILGLHFLVQPSTKGADWGGPFHDLGNLLLGFVMVWAYFAFFQFLIIWSADLPEEAIWYVRRSRGGWLAVGVLLIGLHFVIPFCLLLLRAVKRRVRYLAWLALLVLVARWVDLFWLVMPAFPEQGVHLYWLMPVLLVAMGALWSSFFVGRWLGQAPLPRLDPHLSGENHEPQSEIVNPS